MNGDSDLVLDIGKTAKDIKTFIKNDTVFEIFDDIETLTNILSKCTLNTEDSKYIMSRCKQHYDDVGCFKIFKSLNVNFHDNILEMIDFVSTCFDSLCASPLQSIRDLCLKINDYIFNTSNEVESLRTSITSKDIEITNLKSQPTRDSKTNFIELFKTKIISIDILNRFYKFFEEQSIEKFDENSDSYQFFKFVNEIGLTKIGERQIPILHRACIYDNFNLIKYLLETGSNINVINHLGQNAALCYLQYNSIVNINILKLFVEKGININHRANNGRNAILIASKKYRNDIIEYFISLGLSVNSVDWLNQSCIFLATQSSNPETIQFLYEHGADPDIKNANGLSLMHAAVFTKYNENVSQIVDTLKYLISIGCDKNDKTNENKTCLHYAALNGYAEVVDYLIYLRAKLSERDNSGKTPLDYAKEELNRTKVKLNQIKENLNQPKTPKEVMDQNLFISQNSKLIPEYEKIINSLTKYGAE